jgi:hypothetical protein
MSQHDEVLRTHQVEVDRDRLRLTLPMNVWVFRFWLFVIAWNVFVPALVLSVRLEAPPFMLYFAPLVWIFGAYFAVRAWRNTTVFTFDPETFTATFGPLPPSTTSFTMTISNIVSFDAEYGEDHEEGFVLKALNQEGARIEVPARLHGAVLTPRGSKKRLTGKPPDALVIGLAKALNDLLAESRERQRSFRK